MWSQSRLGAYLAHGKRAAAVVFDAGDVVVDSGVGAHVAVKIRETGWGWSVQCPQ